MSSNTSTRTALQVKLQAHHNQLAEMLADLETYQVFQSERHDQLTRRYEQLERQTEALTNPETVRGQKLTASYERISEQHARSEEELDELENQVIEPLREAREVLGQLLA